MPFRFASGRIGKTSLSVGAVFLVAVAGLSWWFAAGQSPSLAVVKQALSRGAEVSVRVAVDRPDQQGVTQTFTGHGIVSGDGRASLTYDFSSLPNAGGFFGHLIEFEMRVTDERLYLEVLPGDRPWLMVTREELSEFTRSDVARIREAVVASPYLFDALLRADRSTTGDDTVTLVSSPAQLVEQLDGFSLATMEFLETIEAEPVAATFTVDRRSLPVSLRYVIRHPFQKGSADTVSVAVTVDFDALGVDTDFEEPAGSERTTFDELKGEDADSRR